MSIRNKLCQGLKQLDLSLDDNQIQQLVDYVALLDKWNKAYNLTAIRDPLDMVTQHLLDSLAVVPWFADASRILDVGTGAGVPGIPLAIVYPDKQLTLLDSNGKKTRFVQQARRELGLENVRVEQTRVEALQGDNFDMITSRAFADLELMVKLTAHLLAPEGRIAAMKGPRTEQELAALRQHGLNGRHLRDLEIHPLTVPMLDGERYLVCFSLDKS